MEGTVLAAIITGAVALVAVSVTQPITYFFSRKRDHEADWRKLKLELYKEYIAAFSEFSRLGVVSMPRYVDAINSLILVAPPNVLIALNDFHAGLQSPQKGAILCSSLMRAMRNDCHPNAPNDSPDFIFKFGLPIQDYAKTTKN